MSEMLSWGTEVILWAQQFQSPLVAFPLQALSWLGGIGYLFLLPAVVFAFHQNLGLRLALLLSASLFLNCLLKNLVGLERPFDTFADISGGGDGYAFPSGHAQLATVFWGVLALHLKRWPFILTALLLAILTGCSGVYLGAHYPGDVIAGWVLGGATLYAVWRWREPVENYLLNHGPMMQVGCTLGATTVMWALAGFFLNDILLTGAIGFFLGCALAGIVHPPGLAQALPWALRGGRFVLGMLLILLMIAALQRAAGYLEVSTTLISMLSTALLGGWLIGGVPTLLDALTAWLHRRFPEVQRLVVPNRPETRPDNQPENTPAD